ncbi:MAG: hypothetical protein NWR46_00350, partial [Saprospiraceae bacterium]|nr:hypothetical protein [Saprospiraceae bacterium]
MKEQGTDEGRGKSILEDAAMRKLERNWENRVGIEEKWGVLELSQKNNMEKVWNGNPWMRGLDTIRNSSEFSRDALETENYR